MALTNLSQITTSGISTLAGINLNNLTGVAATFTGNVTIGGTLTYDDVTNIDSVGLITARSGVSITGGQLTLPDSIVHAGNDNAKIRFPAADTVTVETGGTERFRIDANGHMGLGVTPSVWPSNGDFRGLQIGTGIAVFGRGSGKEDRGGIAANYYHTGSAQKYIGNGHAGRMYFEDGSIVFSNAAENSSGAGAAMTLTERVRINEHGLSIKNSKSDSLILFCDIWSNSKIDSISLSNKSILPAFTPFSSVPAIGCEPINKS